MLKEYNVGDGYRIVCENVNDILKVTVINIAIFFEPTVESFSTTDKKTANDYFKEVYAKYADKTSVIMPG